jgi:hypothetical protein
MNIGIVISPEEYEKLKLFEERLQKEIEKVAKFKKEAEKYKAMYLKCIKKKGMR